MTEIAANEPDGQVNDDHRNRHFLRPEDRRGPDGEPD